MNDRAADAWSPLLAIADVAGGEWPTRAREAAVELRDAGGAETIREMLLNDIRDAFEMRKVDRLASGDLVAYLIALDERPWPEFNRGKPLTQTGLARLLKPFRILSGTVRIDDGQTRKGYYRSAFADAFARYLRPVKNVATSQTKQAAPLGENQNVTMAAKFGVGRSGGMPNAILMSLAEERWARPHIS